MFGQSYTLHLQTETGILYGRSREIVYQNPGSDDYLSELRWDIKPLVYQGLSLELAQSRPMDHWGFFSALGIRVGIPMKTGTMEDRDWVNHPVSGDLTHFSSHDNFTKAAVLASLDTGFSLPVWKLLLKFHFGLDYMYFKWEARDGYYQYGTKIPGTNYYEPWYSGNKIPISGLALTYRQHWFFLMNGVEAGFTLGPLSFSAAVFFGPVLCISIDDHHDPSKRWRITDVLYQGFFIKPKASVFLSITARWQLGLSVSYLYSSEIRGNSQYEKFTESTTETYYNIAGAQLQLLDASLFVRFRF